MRSGIILSTGVIALGWMLLGAGNADTATNADCCAPTVTLMVADSPTTKPVAKVDAKKAFEEISKAVVGSWKEPPDKDQPANAIDFKLTAAGSVIMETMFPGKPHEMVNTYAIDNDDLLLTHFCASGNQPRMKLVSAENAVYTFELKDVTNLSSPDDAYMGGLKLTIADGKVIEDWTHFEKGKVAGGVHIALSK